MIIGHGRSGTSLCTGLLNSVPEVNIGYEINNDEIEINGNINPKDFPVDFNGNKIAISGSSSFSRFSEFINSGAVITNKKKEDTSFIFTKRNAIDTIVSTKYRNKLKCRNFSVEELVDNYIKAEAIIDQIIEEVGLFFLFDFDAVIEDPRVCKGMFRFVNKEFLNEYVSDYTGTLNYTHATGVKKDNAVHGRKDKYLKLRDEIRREFIRRTFDWKKEKW